MLNMSNIISYIIRTKYTLKLKEFKKWNKKFENSISAGTEMTRGRFSRYSLINNRS